MLAALLHRQYGGRIVEPRFAGTIERARHERYYGVYFQRQRIGYVRYELSPQADGYRLDQEAVLLLNVLGERLRITMQVRAALDDAMILQRFSFAFASPFYTMTATGRVEGSVVHYRLTTGKEVFDDRVELARPPVLSTSQRPYLLRPLPAEGETLRLVTFDPLTLAGVPTVVEYRGKEKVLVAGRVELLHHFVETVAGVRVSFWLDDEGGVVKEESPAGFVFLREPKFRAMDIGAPAAEMLAAAAAPLLGRIPADVGSRTSMRYRLHLPAGVTVQADGGRQQYVDGVLTVHREPLPDAAAPPCDGAPAAALAATPYVQAGAPAIVAQADLLVEGRAGGLDRVRSIAAWVYEAIDKRPVVGLPDALATLKGRRGDCNEHAALFAALARAAGIPTRIVAGVVYAGDAFYYHAWNEVCVGDRWISVDTTRNEIPADLTHIRLADGEGTELLTISALVGRLSIEVVDGPDPR